MSISSGLPPAAPVTTRAPEPQAMPAKPEKRGALPRGQDFRLPLRPSRSIEGLEVNLVPFGVEDDEHRLASLFQPRAFGDDVKRGDPDRGLSERQREAARSGNADTDPGERSWTYRHGNPIDLAEFPARGAQGLIHEFHEALRVATSDIRARACQKFSGAAVVDGSETTGPGCINGKN